MPLTHDLVNTVDKLDSIKRRIGELRDTFTYQAMVCSGTPCQAADSLALKNIIEEYIKLYHLEDKVSVSECGCMGFCAVGPVMIVNPEGIFYQKLTREDIKEIVKSHFMNDTPVEKFMHRDESTGTLYRYVKDVPFLSSQKLIVLKNSGYMNPENIEDYIYRDGYRAAYMALADKSTAEIIGEVKASGLRGRGGGGFPTGLKWEFCAASKSDEKYVLCNADEGDPGAFMDRSILESDPHSVIEGMIIAARAIGAKQGYVYCRAEYPLALKRLQKAIDQAEAYGFLGKNIFNTYFDFHLEIYKGAGAFVCGEETALMQSIEGKRGTPRPRPPFPAVSGLWGKPTVLNNVETYSNIPNIVLNGGDEYAKIGTDSAKGTKVFALSGDIKNFGLVEVPMGTPIGKVIFDIGGGIPDGNRFKAVQLGGPSGGCLPAEHLNTLIDYDAIIKAGAIMGSGGMVVMDEHTCMVDIARYFMEFCQDESCGKCTPCRIGTRRMLEILQRICRGEGQDGDIELLEDLAKTIGDSALCGLGQTAPNPVLSTLRYFRKEYEDHIYRKTCTAAVCRDMFVSTCQHACPVGMDIPSYIALVKAHRLEDAYKVLLRTNPFPSICGRVCDHVCETKCRRAQMDQAVAIKNLKRFITDNAVRPAVHAVPITRKEKIGVVGAGASGLAAALELRKRGYAVTVYEEMPEPGGMMRYGIPDYRLPHRILKGEIDDIRKAGVEIKTRTKIGRDITINELLDTYDYLYFAIGAQQSAKLDIRGESSRGVYGAVELLRQINSGKKTKLGKHVSVIGGGNSAIDSARSAMRMGAETVTVYYRRERQDLPALKEEVNEAEEEGVRFEFLVAPSKIIAKNHHVVGLELQRMKLGSFDSSGRKKPVPIDDETFTVATDTVIAAIGQKAVYDDPAWMDMIGVKKDWVPVDRHMKTCHGRIWAGGDVVSGPGMVIGAVRAGRDAAIAIDNKIRADNNEPDWQAPVEEEIYIPVELDEKADQITREEMPELSISERRNSYHEVELGYTQKAALREAGRCLRCDVDKLEKSNK
ncbi:MAG: NADH-ubiquinone oxidoreductase-F iron-sulfur binding region domain-containing protein [Candidatus Zixiibacteriota bacterium]